MDNTTERDQNQREPRDQRENRDQREQRPPHMRMRKKRKICTFCAEQIKEIDYKDIPRLKKFLSDRSKILPRRITGNCAKHQRTLTTAVKRARYIALIPYVSD
jgi:small subunit ribosomal protein S18